MARILMTWELGAGRGHLLPLRSLALGLRAAGHHVELAVRDPVDAGPFLEPVELRFHAAPIPAPPCTPLCPRMGIRPVCGRPTLPRASCRFTMARTLSLP